MELVINDRIRQRKIEFFNSFNISLRYNSISSTFSFDFYYDPDVIEQKEMACVGHDHICQLFHEGELILTGYILSEAFSDTPTRKLVPIGGYSLPGFLEDCQVPTNEAIDKAIAFGNLKLPKNITKTPYCYPIQDEGLTLKQIAEKYLAPFNLKIVIDSSVAELMEQQFEETSTKPNDTIKQYLTDLCTQKNIIVSHNEYGNVVFGKAKTKQKPIMEFNVPKGGLPGIKMDLNFNGQEMHSQITVMKQADIDSSNVGEFTVTNPFVPFVFRPRTIIQSSGSNIDTELAANNALAAELRALKVTIAIDRWDVNGKLIRPNNVVSVINPDIYLFKKTNLFIEAIDYKGDQKEMTAVLHCVLPIVYDGTKVDGDKSAYTFQGINLH